jgi:hypothetical protein
VELRQLQQWLVDEKRADEEPLTRAKTQAIRHRSCSPQFINVEGGAMFKVFVGRDEKRELLAGQLASFERLRDAQTSAA